MENEIIDKPNLFEKVAGVIKKKKKLFSVIIILIILTLLGIIYFDYHKENQNKEISEKYIKAGIYLSSQDKEKSKNLYEEIVLSKNKFYSFLALNSIIEHNLEENSAHVLELFKSIEHISIDSEQENLIKFKKALYLIKISKAEEGNRLLNEIISSNSMWKEVALEALK